MKRKQITIIILALVLFSSFITVQSQEKIELQTMYSIILTVFKNDSVILDKIDVMNSTISTFPTYQTNYNLKILSNNREELFKS
ncbi:MAG: hypothetical protein V1944_00390, partial [Candidatus Aenigmatarchaeota archaeon]